jgi:hypothetical protein
LVPLYKKKQKNSKKLLTLNFDCGIMSIPLRVGFFVVSKSAKDTELPDEGGTQEPSVIPKGSNNKKWEVPLTWLMMQESR